MCKSKFLILLVLLILGLNLFGGFDYDNYYLSAATDDYDNYYTHSFTGTPTVSLDYCPDYIDVNWNANGSYVYFYFDIDENTTGEYRSGYIGVTLTYSGSNPDSGMFSIGQACYPATNPIQALIDAASSGDTITLTADATYTGPLDISNKSVKIIGINTTIEGAGHSPVLTFLNSEGSELSGLTITGGTYGTGGGIYSSGSELTVSNCIIQGNLGKNYRSAGLINEGYGGGVYTTGSSEIELENVVMYGNSAYQGSNVYRTGSGSGNTISIDKCSIDSNGNDNLYNVGNDSYFTVSNTIIRKPNLSDITWTYCGAYNTTLTTFPGTGNFITSDPEFVDYTNHDYHLLYASPCIDVGDPTTTESDHSPLDIGCYPYKGRDVFCYETKRYMWMCYPRLNVSDGVNRGTDNVDCLNPSDIWENWWSTIPAQIYAFHEDDVNEEVHGTYSQGTWTWVTGDDYDIYSWMGLKVGAYYYQGVGGFLMDEGAASLYTYDDLPDNEESWLGYYLEDSQTPAEAISSSVLNELLMIKTQRWSVSRSSTNSRWYIPSSYKFNYSDMVILVPESDVSGFQWQGSQGGRSITEPYIRPRAEHFEWVEEIDYLPIYVEFDPANIPEEVAVYVNGVCKGAQVVEDSTSQICAYVLEEEPGLEIEFVFYDGERSNIETDLKVIDNSSEIVIGKKLYTGITDRFCRVSFNQNNKVPAEMKYNVTCSPNPFNPQTYISFDLEQESEIKLRIYNLKGQILSTLADELFRKGSYKLCWDGDTVTGKQVGSGIYFYRLEIGSDVVNGKMIMLK